MIFLMTYKRLFTPRIYIRILDGLANEWFIFHLSDRQKYVSINGYDSIKLQVQWLVSFCFRSTSMI